MLRALVNQMKIAPPPLCKKSSKCSRMIVDAITEVTGVNCEKVRLILLDNLGLRKVCVKLVPRLLTSSRKEARQSTCQDWLDNSGMFDRAITGDKS